MDLTDTKKIEDEISNCDNVSNLFLNLKNEYKDDYCKLLCAILSNTKDTICAKNVIVEINKNTYRDCLPALTDFILTKNEKDFTSNSDNVDVEALKVMCAKTIGIIGDKSAVPSLLYCLNNNHENYKFRLAAAEALGKIGDSNAVESLINVVKNDSEKSVYLRESAALALGMIGDLRALDPFINFLTGSQCVKSKFSFLKERIIEALGNFAYNSDRRIVDVLDSALLDTSSAVRLNALETISNTMCVEMFDKVRELLFDEDIEIVEAALITLYNLKGASALNEILDDENMPKLIQDAAGEILNEYEK